MAKRKKIKEMLRPEPNPAAVALGRLGGEATAKKGSDYYRKIAAKRRSFKGGRPPKVKNQ
jgi:hypothetical protein